MQRKRANKSKSLTQIRRQETPSSLSPVLSIEEAEEDLPMINIDGIFVDIANMVDIEFSRKYNDVNVRVLIESVKDAYSIMSQTYSVGVANKKDPYFKTLVAGRLWYMLSNVNKIFKTKNEIATRMHFIRMFEQIKSRLPTLKDVLLMSYDIIVSHNMQRLKNDTQFRKSFHNFDTFRGMYMKKSVEGFEKSLVFNELRNANENMNYRQRDVQKAIRSILSQSKTSPVREADMWKSPRFSAASSGDDDSSRPVPLKPIPDKKKRHNNSRIQKKKKLT